MSFSTLLTDNDRALRDSRGVRARFPAAGGLRVDSDNRSQSSFDRLPSEILEGEPRPRGTPLEPLPGDEAAHADAPTVRILDQGLTDHSVGVPDLDAAGRPILVPRLNLPSEVDNTTPTANNNASGPTTDILISPRKTSRRAIFVDWARSIAVYIVVFVHIFVSVQRVTTPPPVMKEKIDGSFRVVLQFGMPMFFYFSGRSASFGNVGFLLFLKGKLLRLVLPLIIGMLVVVVPTNYVGRAYRGCGLKDVDNFFAFYASYFGNFGCNGFDWYWFLPVLFIISVLNHYFLFWIKTRDREVVGNTGLWDDPNGGEGDEKARKKRDDDEGAARSESVAPRASPAPIGTPAGDSQGCCGKWFMFDPKRDIGPLIFVAVLLGATGGAAIGIGAPYLIFLFAFMPHLCLYIITLCRKVVRRFRMIYLLYLPCPLFSLALAAIAEDHYSDNSSFSSFSGVVLMCLFYNFYYVQGYLDTVYDEDWHQWRDNASLHAGLKPLALIGLILGVAICTPTSPQLAGYLYEYPMYKADHYLCVSYVLGGWVWLMLWIRYAQTFYNEVLNQFEYTHITTSSMIVYLTHWFFIDCISVLIIKPAEMGLVGGVAVLIPGVAICCGLLYFGICQVERVAKRLCCRGGGKGRRAQGSDKKREDDEATGRPRPASTDPVASEQGSEMRELPRR